MNNISTEFWGGRNGRYSCNMNFGLRVNAPPFRGLPNLIIRSTGGILGFFRVHNPKL